MVLPLAYYRVYKYNSFSTRVEHGWLVTFVLFVGDIRLVDGGAPNQGRVEIYINDSWWTICDNWFGYDEGRVVCKQLGLPALYDVYYGGTFGQGNGSRLREEYNCQGSETSLLNCSKTGYISYSCDRWDDVGITCGPLVKAGMWSGIYTALQLMKVLDRNVYFY